MNKPFCRALVFVAGAAGLAACGPDVPASPTWEHDIHPLLVARCIRCHNANSKVDPSVTGASVKIPVPATFNFDYATQAEVPAIALTFLKAASSYTSAGAPAGLFMPPAPAAALEDWQVEMLKNWASHLP